MSDEAATMTRAAKTRILADGWKATCFPPSTAKCPRTSSRGSPPEGVGGEGRTGWNGNTDEGCKSWILRTGTRATDLTDPSELLRMKTADPVAEGRGGGRRRGGALEGSRSNRHSARRGARVSPRCHGRRSGKTAAHSGSGLSNMVNETSAARAARIIQTADQSDAAAL